MMAAAPDAGLFANLPAGTARCCRPAPAGGTKPKLRSACDLCHAAKVKCSGEAVCARCSSQALPCTYSYAMRAGKPKGSRNRKTLEKQARLRQQYHDQQHHDTDWQTTNTAAMDLDLQLAPSLWADPTTMDFAYLEDRARVIQPSPGGPATVRPAASATNTSAINPTGTSSAFTDVDPFLLADDPQTPLLQLDSFPNSLLLPADQDLVDIINANSVNSGSASSPSATTASDTFFCACFEAQTANLNSLYALHRALLQHSHPSPPSPPFSTPQQAPSYRIDDAVQRINTALASTRAILSCPRCSGDGPTLLLAVAAFQLALRLLQHLVAEGENGLQEQQQQTQQGRDPDEPGHEHKGHCCALPPTYRIAEYDVSRDEYAAVRTVLVRRALHRAEETLKGLRGLADGRVQTTRQQEGRESVSSSRGSSSSSAAAVACHFGAALPLSPLSPLASPESLMAQGGVGCVAGRIQDGGDEHDQRDEECSEGVVEQDAAVAEVGLGGAEAAFLRRVVCEGEVMLKMCIRNVSRDLCNIV